MDMLRLFDKAALYTERAIRNAWREPFNLLFQSRICKKSFSLSCFCPSSFCSHWLRQCLRMAWSVSSDHGEWMAVNSSKKETVTVTYEFTDLTLDRTQRVTRVIPPNGKVRICPVAGNSEPKSVNRR